MFIAQFTATVTSSLTVQTLTGDINGLEDLPGKRIVAVGEFAADYLNEQDVRFTRLDQTREAYALLETSRTDALVGPTPDLYYYASKDGNGKVAVVVGPVFTVLPIGMVLPLDSPLRKPINEAILRFNEDGTRSEIIGRWFGDCRGKWITLDSLFLRNRAFFLSWSFTQSDPLNGCPERVHLKYAVIGDGVGLHVAVMWLLHPPGCSAHTSNPSRYPGNLECAAQGRMAFEGAHFAGERSKCFAEKNVAVKKR